MRLDWIAQRVAAHGGTLGNHAHYRGVNTMAQCQWYLVHYTLRGEARVLKLSSRVSADLFAASVRHAGAKGVKVRRA